MVAVSQQLKDLNICVGLDCSSNKAAMAYFRCQVMLYHFSVCLGPTPLRGRGGLSHQLQIPRPLVQFTHNRRVLNTSSTFRNRQFISSPITIFCVNKYVVECCGLVKKINSVNWNTNFTEFAIQCLRKTNLERWMDDQSWFPARRRSDTLGAKSPEGAAVRIGEEGKGGSCPKYKVWGWRRTCPLTTISIRTFFFIKYMKNLNTSVCYSILNR